MRKAICLILLVIFTVPLFADGMLKVMDTDEYKRLIDEKTNLQGDNGILKSQLEKCDKQNTRLLIDNNKLLAESIQKGIDKETDKKISSTAKCILGGFGLWGVYTFAVTGGAYPLVTGCLFIWGAMR
jgi:hypothetical protein